MMVSRFTRFMTLLLAAIQFAAPAVASVAEGTFSKRVADPIAHIEESGQNDCAPPHAADCTMCRFLVDGAGCLPAAASVLIIADVPSSPTAAVTAASGPARQGFDARGPPAIAG
jgi:hypothetical protein